MEDFKMDCGTVDCAVQALRVMDTLGLRWNTGQVPSERVPDRVRFLYVEDNEISFDRDDLADSDFFDGYPLEEVYFDEFIATYGKPQIKYQFDTAEFEAMLCGASYGGEYN